MADKTIDEKVVEGVAGSGDAQALLMNLVNLVDNLWTAISAVAFVVGLALVAFAGVKAYRVSQDGFGGGVGDPRYSLMSVVVTLLAAALFMNLSGFLEAASGTAGFEATGYQDTLAYAESSRDATIDEEEVWDALGALFLPLALWAVANAVWQMKLAGEQDPRGSIATALQFLLAGVVLANVGDFLAALMGTLGLAAPTL